MPSTQNSQQISIPNTKGPQTILGFDYGKRRTGVAVGQTITGTATAVTTLRWNSDSPDWHAIEKLIEEWRPQAIVVGTPITQQNRQNRQNEIQRLVEHFCHRLHSQFALPIHIFDESYTSAEAYRRLKSMRQSGRSKRISKEDIDSLAAAILLESWMAS